jgi:hypothetical protein
VIAMATDYLFTPLREVITVLVRPSNSLRSNAVERWSILAYLGKAYLGKDWSLAGLPEEAGSV